MARRLTGAQLREWYSAIAEACEKAALRERLEAHKQRQIETRACMSLHVRGMGWVDLKYRPGVV